MEQNLPNIIFPYLGLEFNLDGVALYLGSMPVYWYGVIIGVASLLGLLLAVRNGKKEDIDENFFYDLFPFALLFAIMGARIYYVIFEWDAYKDNLLEIFNLRHGGLALYGGLIGGGLFLFIYCIRKKINFAKLADITIPSFILGQAIGRYGNFFNLEAYGTYTNNMFSMQLLKSDVKYFNDDILNNIVNINGMEYIQVHPTFFYESTINLFILTFLLFRLPRRKFYGEIVLWYMTLYGMNRFFVEGLRVDQLIIANTGIAVSQALSLVMIIAGVVGMFVIKKLQQDNKLPKYLQREILEK